MGSHRSLSSITSPLCIFLLILAYLGFAFSPQMLTLLSHLTPFSHPPAEQPGAPGRSRLTSVGPDVPFQIKGVVEAFPAEGAQVSLHLAVALDVAVEHALQAEALATQLAGVHRGIVTGARGELGKGTGPAELYRHGKDHKKKKKKTSCLGSSPFSTAR